MEIYKGKGVSGGIVSGRIWRMFSRRTEKQLTVHADPAEERERFRIAAERLAEELENLNQKTKDSHGDEAAAIFSVQRMMLEAEEFTEPILDAVAHGICAETAVLNAGEALAASLASMDIPYMQDRAADIRSVAGRLAEFLQGKTVQLPDTDFPVILAAEDLTPAQTMSLDPEKIVGFVTEKGSPRSHTAILARSLHLSAAADLGGLPDTVHGREAILDGTGGILYVDPDRATREKLQKAAEDEQKNRTALESLRGVTCTDAAGRQIRICANAGSMAEIRAAAAADAEGIGLFRSEFLFMQYDRCPTEEEQYTVYREVLERMGGREVVIRTLDAGADKQLFWLAAGEAESNPALGLRAVRLCLRYPELLQGQLRAMYRAAVHGKLCAMIPMITTPDELNTVRRIAGEVRQSLSEEQYPFDPSMPIGIMIETPSAALLAETLAAGADFFSLGTNDLIQYTMAADRENPAVSYLTEGLPEGVKTLIQITGEAAAKAGIPVSVCGELASDPAVIPFLLEAGATTLSVTPGKVLQTRSRVREILTSEEP